MIFSGKIYYRSASFLLLVCIFVSCEKFNLERNNTHDPESTHFKPSLPQITADDASVIKTTSVTISAEILRDGGSPVTTRGFCWSVAQNPTIEDTKKDEGAGTGKFTVSVSGLSQGATYYLRAYSTNTVGTSYSLQKRVTTLDVPKVYTNAVTSTKATSTFAGGDVTSDGGTPVTERGLCWSTTINPTIENFKQNEGHGTGKFSCYMLGLIPGQKYFFRAYAINDIGISYGLEFDFIALGVGDTYQGGIVAYLLKAGNPGYVEGEIHGFIIAPSNQSTGIKWADMAVYGTNMSLGFGNNNTNSIVSNLGQGNYAAKICYDLELNGFSDWYLPSTGDLLAIYPNKTAIGGFTNTYYWTSHFNTANEAWTVNLANGETISLSITGNAYVRAIRSF